MISKINFTDVNPISNRETSLIKKDLYYTIKNKDFILGKNVKRFENNFSKLSKIKYSILKIKISKFSEDSFKT